MRKQYTQQEINKALKELNLRLERKELDRKEINSEIRAIRDNIKYYENLDMSQLKLFTS